MSPFDLAIEARFLAVFLGFVVLLALLEESVSRVVVGQVLGVFLVGDAVLRRRAVP
jgi:hypothetical protein